MSFSIRQGAVIAVVSSLPFLAVSAQAATLEITITNTAQTGGFAFTPVYAAFHDGNFDAFDVGSSASAGVERLAELGQAADLPAERLAQSPDSVALNIAAPMSGPPTVDPGETTSAKIDVDGSTNRFFSFLSMLVPSNDTFFGNDNPLAYALFDAAGVFLGDQVIEVTAASLYDAGTEVNNPTGGPAFVAGQIGTDGVDEGGVIHAATSFASFAGVGTPLGPLDGSLIDFTSDRAGFSIATINIREVPAPVPLPASSLLGLAGLASLAGMRFLGKRRKTI